jgi:hypothetical protein
MSIEFPLTPDNIREEMERIISSIREETNWELHRNLTEVTIEIGDAPEKGSLFGISRMPKELAFGSWIADLQPDYYRTNIAEFVIIRESISFFIDNELVFDSDQELIQDILFLCAIAFWRRMYEGREFETRLVNVRQLLLIATEDLTEEERSKHALIQALSNTIISQKISYNLAVETSLHFIGEPPYIEIDELEIMLLLYRFFSDIPDEIVAPISLKPKSLQVLEKVIELGFKATPIAISKILKKDNASIHREFTRIASRYNAFFRVEKNFHKLGLHYYSIIIRFNDLDNKERIINELENIEYIGEIYEGSGNDKEYVYSIVLCPHFIAETLGTKLERLQRNNFLSSFEIKPLKNRIYMTTFVEGRFQPSIENYKKLLNNKIRSKKLKIWDNNRFSQNPPMNFEEKENNLLKAISVYQSHSIANNRYYRVFTTEMYSFASENNVNTKEMGKVLGFMNNQRNQLLDKELIDFRLELTLTNIAIDDMLIIKVKCDPDTEEIQKLIDKISIFSWTAFNIAFDSIIIRVLGLNNKHAISKLLSDTINEDGFEYEMFTVNKKVWRYIPFADLYHHQGNKWALR